MKMLNLEILRNTTGTKPQGNSQDEEKARSKLSRKFSLIEMLSLMCKDIKTGTYNLSLCV